jgi:hypothetical protein
MKKEIKEHGSSNVTSKPLLEDMRWISYQLVEDASGSGKVVVRGEFARSGIATENKRVYPRSLWVRELKKLRKAMEERRLFGELDHPSDGRTQLARASHIITNLEIEDEGRVLGEAEVMDTSRGRDLKELLKSGCKVGVSSRGYGSTRTNQKGEEIVQEDYNLVTFDFVAEPADSTAYPEVFSEDKETTSMLSPDEKEAEMAQAQKFADRIEKERKAEAEGDAEEPKDQDDADDKEKSEALKAQFERDIISNLGKLSSAARERIRSEVLADPMVGRAKTALEQIKDVLRPFVIPEDAAAVVKQKDEEINRLQTQIKDRDLKLRTYESQMESLARMAREAGYKYFLERALTGNPEREGVLKMLGDLSAYESAEALKARVGDILGEIVARRKDEALKRAALEAHEREIREAAERETARVKKEATEAQRQVQQLKSALEKSLEANKLLGVQVYAEQRVRNHPQGSKLRKLIERAGVTTKGDVDQILEEAREPVRDSDEIDRIRSRVRERTKGGRSSTPMDEEKRPEPVTPEAATDYNGLGVDLDTLRALARISPTR